MAVNGTHDVGEEFKQKSIFRTDLITRPGTLEVLLYNDATDNLGEASDVGDITTEPTTGNYTRQTLSFDSGDLSLSVDGSGDLQVDGGVTFDTLDTGDTVDGYALVASFQSDVVNSETGANNHIIASATFGTTDLSNFSDITVNFQDTLS
jgi:hypothetical protein